MSHQMFLGLGGKRMASSKPQNCDTESQSIHYPEVSKTKNPSLMSQASSTTIIPTASRSVDPVNTSITAPDPSTITQPFTCNQSSNEKSLITSKNILNGHHPSSSGKNIRTTSESTISDDKSTPLPSSENSITTPPQKEGNVPKNISSFNDVRSMQLISQNKSMQNDALEIPSEPNIPKSHHSTNSNGFPPLANSNANSGHSVKPASNCNHQTIQINGQIIDESSQTTTSVTSNNINGNNNNNIVNTTTTGNSTPKNGTPTQDVGNQQLAKNTSNGTSTNKQMRWADLFNKSDETPTAASLSAPKPTLAKPPPSSKQEKPTTPLPNGKPAAGGLAAFGEPILPDYVYDALRGLKRFDSMKGRQEDAEEFLGFLLDGLHEEFLAESQGTRNKQSANGNNDLAEKPGSNKNDGNENAWMETDIEESPISRIFGGQLRSVLQCPGSIDSITLEPFQSLQLDIQPDDVKTVGDALKNLTNPEYVDDFYTAKKDLVRATKRLYIETLPPILTLHLKRFVYDNVGGTQKLSKHIGYSTTLSIQQVVYHHGKSATGGHYTADILRYDDEWLHIDDTSITQISAEEVAILENPTQPTDLIDTIAK
ncbi:15618_t:CDS:2 [Racocetra fulgida]|uniref:ubiquitinyl hydrolase 1 n=1 Tax=Racocetra fulgida TaxID=60492 RepID=A0A9N9F5S0_9GLOM|nr:15618_t:CDS:2 [Racocetra fulgida]